VDPSLLLWLVFFLYFNSLDVLSAFSFPLNFGSAVNPVLFFVPIVAQLCGIVVLNCVGEFAHHTFPMAELNSCSAFSSRQPRQLTVLIPASSPKNFLFVGAGKIVCYNTEVSLNEVLEMNFGSNFFLVQEGRVVRIDEVLPDQVIHVSYRAHGGMISHLNGGTNFCLNGDSVDRFCCEIVVGK
jgi:hypothetical protein